MYFVHSSVNSLHENLRLYLQWNLKSCLASAWWKTLVETASGFSMQPAPPSLFPFQCLILQIDIISCIIRPLIHHGNGLGRSVAQMCFSPPIAGCVQSFRAPLLLLLLLLLLLQGFGSSSREAGGRGGAEGGGGGCNWRLETCYPSRCPHQPISILSAVQSKRSIKKTRRLTCIWI